MKKYLATAALAAALAQSASAVTFPSLTTIYVGSGVYDSASSDNVGVATAVHCSNVSGVSVEVRVLILGSTGAVAGSLTRTLAHGTTATFVTHLTTAFLDAGNSLATAGVGQGVVNVESTNSGVFCTAMIVNAATVDPNASPIHLVRVNPHPGTVE